MDGAIVAIGSRRKIRARNPEPEPAATKRLCVTPLALADDNQAAGHNETRQRYDVLQSRNLPELAQQPDEKIRLHEQKHGAGHGRTRDLSAAFVNAWSRTATPIEPKSSAISSRIRSRRHAKSTIVKRNNEPSAPA
jgi:hypothetical protein